VTTCQCGVDIHSQIVPHDFQREALMHGNAERFLGRPVVTA
jgi:hypothetical protein